MLFEHLPASTFFRKEVPPYEDIYGLHSLFGKVAFEQNIVLMGPKGIGKSLSVVSYASKNQIPIITYDCSEDSRRSHLMGTFILRGNETPFVLGPLTTAYQVANEAGECILCLEELNALSPQAQKLLNPLLDFRCRLEVPEVQHVFELKSGAKLWVVGTMNGSAYGGTYALNEDLLSRISMCPLGYPSETQEKKVIAKAYPEAKEVDVSSAIRLAEMTRSGKSVEYSLSTRDVVSFLRLQNLVGIRKALWMLSAKYEDELKAFNQFANMVYNYVPRQTNG